MVCPGAAVLLVPLALLETLDDERTGAVVGCADDRLLPLFEEAVEKIVAMPDEGNV